MYNLVTFVLYVQFRSSAQNTVVPTIVVCGSDSTVDHEYESNLLVFARPAFARLRARVHSSQAVL